LIILISAPIKGHRHHVAPGDTVVGVAILGFLPLVDGGYLDSNRSSYSDGQL